MLNPRILVSGFAMTAVLCSSVAAQDAKQKQNVLPPTIANQGENKDVANRTEASITPQQIAACLALDNQEAVILAKFAQDKSKNGEVKDLAKMIGEEHQACLKKLSKFAPEASQDGFLTASNPNEQKLAPVTGAKGSIDMMQLQREIAQQCIVDSKQYLSKKDGAEFDKCFVGMQIAKHAAMHTKLVVLQRHTSEELQQIVAEGMQTTAKHMKVAESLMARLDSQAADKLTQNTKE